MMQVIKAELTDAKSRHYPMKELYLSELIGQEITIVFEEKNDGLIGTLESEKAYAEAEMVIRLRPIYK
jgi:hypothetical protein